MLKPSLQVHEVDGVLLAEFWDCLRLDPAPTLELRRKFDEHLKNGGRPFVVIDLQGVEFAGSASLGNFVALQRTTRQNKGRVVFCRVEPTVMEVFRASNLERLFEFGADRDAALDAVERGEFEAEESAPDQLEVRSAPPRSTSPSPLNRLRRKRDATESQ